MSRYWLATNEHRFLTDILRDFCQISSIFEEQALRFATAGNLSFAVLRDLTGDLMNKGQLWHLKDMTHHLLRDVACPSPAGQVLDWAIGYIFHESLKLLEDAHQNQYYAPRLAALANGAAFHAEPEAAQAFFAMAAETNANMQRGLLHIQRSIAYARKFFPALYAGQANNRHLARFLYEQNDLARKNLKEEYHALIRAIYADSPAALYVEAAASLTEAGQYAEAATAAQYAARIQTI